MKSMVQSLALVGALGAGGLALSGGGRARSGPARACLFGLAGRRRPFYGRSDGRLHA